MFQLFSFSLQFKDLIVLNICGQSFTTSMSVLKKEPSSLFASMFDGSRTLPLTPDGKYFIDADPDAVSHILHYLRDDVLPPNDVALRKCEHLTIFTITRLRQLLNRC